MKPQSPLKERKPRYLLLVSSVIAGALLISTLALSCQTPGPVEPPPPEPEPTPEPSPEPELPPAPEPSPEPAPELTGQWSADGVIQSNEYLGEMAYGDFEIYWVSDEQHIYVGLRAETTGWVAVGIQPGSRMKDADMVMGLVSGGETTILDMFSTGDFGPHSPDTELGGTDDILEFGGSEEGSYTTIEFKRLLDTGDQFDLPLSSGTHQIIWAYGATDSESQRHATRGYGEIQIP